MKDKFGYVLAQVPFNSKLKRSIVAVKHPGLEDTVRIYVKGAPEIVLAACPNHYNENCQKVPMSDQERDYLIEDTMHSRMTTQGLRPIAFSINDMSMS